MKCETVTQEIYSFHFILNLILFMKEMLQKIIFNSIWVFSFYFIAVLCTFFKIKFTISFLGFFLLFFFKHLVFKTGIYLSLLLFNVLKSEKRSIIYFKCSFLGLG